MNTNTAPIVVRNLTPIDETLPAQVIAAELERRMNYEDEPDDNKYCKFKVTPVGTFQGRPVFRLDDPFGSTFDFVFADETSALPTIEVNTGDDLSEHLKSGHT